MRCFLGRGFGSGRRGVWMSFVVFVVVFGRFFGCLVIVVGGF